MVPYKVSLRNILSKESILPLILLLATILLFIYVSVVFLGPVKYSFQFTLAVLGIVNIINIVTRKKIYVHLFDGFYEIKATVHYDNVRNTIYSKKYISGATNYTELITKAEYLIYSDEVKLHKGKEVFISNVIVNKIEDNNE